MSRDTLMTGTAHPAPQRDRAPYALLAFVLFAAPIGWALRLIANYSVASQACAPLGLAGGREALSAVLLIDLAAAILAAVAAYAAFGLWLRTQSEVETDVHRLVHAGEGRTRFLAMCGMLTSLLFALASAIDAFGIILGPQC